MNDRAFRTQLLSKRRELTVSLDGLRLNNLASHGRVAEEDQAQIEHEEFISTHRNNVSCDTLRLVDQALDRIDGGEFGVCQECGEEISEKRLRAIPWATYCVHCQDRIGNPDYPFVANALDRSAFRPTEVPV
jgi:DnaK suppressor protein